MNKIISEDLSKYLSSKRKCVICGEDNFDNWCKQDFFNILKCKNCKLVFVNPCLNNKGLDIVYKGHHLNRISNEEETKKRNLQYIIDRNYLEETINEGNILDVGCGGGFFLSNFNKEKWKLSGLEIDPDTSPFAKKKFDINVNIGSSEKMPFNSEIFDVVSFRGSFEHLINPQITMKEIKRVLKPGGFLYICAIPNVESYCAKLYKQKWNQFDAKEHVFMFSLKTLKKLVSKFGFREIKSCYFYQETPYANIQEDMEQVLKDYKLISQGKFNEVSVSPPFWENMLSVLFCKE